MKRTLLAGLVFCSGLSCGGEDPMTMFPPPVTKGRAEISWRLVDDQMQPVDCATTPISSIRVSFGREPVTVNCGDDNKVVFQELAPDRYPLVISLLAASGGQLGQHLANVVVEGGKTAEYQHDFVVSSSGLESGDLRIRWAVDMMPAHLRCAALGAENVRVRTSVGALEEVDETIACKEGVLLIKDLTRGSYNFRLDMLSKTSTTVGFPATLRNIRVNQGETTEESVSFVSVLPEKAGLRASWTIGSTVAQDACDMVNADTVDIQVRTDAAGTINLIETSTSCKAGEFVLDDLPAGPGSTGMGLRVTMRLFDTRVGTIPLDIQTVRRVVLKAAETSTLAVDFQVEP